VTFLVRAWMPDRPGALGAVASRIGSVRGDLVGIDILERGGGRAIDELAVELADRDLVPLLVREICQVDGVDVEDVREAESQLVDARLDALETAGELVACRDAQSLAARLAEHSARDLEAEWAAVVEAAGPAVLSGVGAVPPATWLTAFVTGSRSSAPGHSAGPADVAWADLPGAGLVLVLGRGTAEGGRPFRARERRQLSALARIADERWAELAARSSRRLHPSTAV
jgi:hypothetical protein